MRALFSFCLSLHRPKKNEDPEYRHSPQVAAALTGRLNAERSEGNDIDPPPTYRGYADSGIANNTRQVGVVFCP